MLKGTIALTTVFLVFISASAFAVKTASRTHSVTFHEHQFDRIQFTVMNGDRVRICNKDNFQHRPFSRNQYNRFEVRLQPGKCYEFRANNPLPSRTELRVYDSIHSKERLVILVESNQSWLGPKPEPQADRRAPKWLVFVDEKKQLCCAADEWNSYPNKKKGEIPLQLFVGSDDNPDRNRLRVLKDGFKTRQNAVDWVCRHRIVRGGRWTSNYARINGVLVGNTPCRNLEGPPR